MKSTRGWAGMGIGGVFPLEEHVEEIDRIVQTAVQKVLERTREDRPRPKEPEVAAPIVEPHPARQRRPLPLPKLPPSAPVEPVKIPSEPEPSLAPKGKVAPPPATRKVPLRFDTFSEPFPILEPYEQVFVLGYLCHLATDEITARRAGEKNRELVTSGGALPHIDAILTVLDGRIWAAASDPAGVTMALVTAPIPDGTLVFAPRECLAAMHRIILPQIQAGGGLGPVLDMMCSQRLWLRFGDQGATAADVAGLKAELRAYRCHIAADMPAAESWVGGLDVESYVTEATNHSLQRIQVLLGKEGMQ